jgi:NADH-quinone oxidoreductase subunit E
MIFSFNSENKKKAESILNFYPKERRQSAIMPLLTIAQDQNENYLTDEIIDYVADFLNLPVIKVSEVATFYTMYNHKPVGTYHIQVCNNVMCYIKGSEDIIKTLEEETKVKADSGLSKDKLFSIIKVECLGACCNAPMMQVNKTFYEDLTKDKIKNLISSLKKSKSTSL